MVLDKIFLALCGVALLIRLLLEPFLNNFEALGQEHIATLVNSFILFVIAFLYILKKTVLHENIRFPRALRFLMFFCLLASLSAFNSIDTPSTILYQFDLWASFFFMLVLVNLLSTQRSIEVMAGVMILLLVIAATNAVYENWVILPKIIAQTANGVNSANRGFLELLSSHRVPTLFGWPNIFSGFVVMTLPLTMIYLEPKRLRAIKLMAIAVTLLALYALYVTMTVSSWMGVLAAALIFLLILKKRSFTSQEKIAGALIISVIVVSLVFTIIKKMTLPGVNSTDARLQYLISTCHLIKLHPFLGSGFRSLGVASAAYIKDINGRSFFAHNSYLQIWAELGILGLILYLRYLWCLWKDAFVFFQEKHRKHSWLAAGIIAGIAGCMVDNLFSYTMIKPQISLFWWVLGALLMAFQENGEPSKGNGKNQRAWKKGMLVIILVGGVLTARLTLAEYKFFTAVHYIHQGVEFPKAALLCREAKEFNPWDKKFDLARAYALYGLFTINHDIHTLQMAREAALLAEGQVSLNFEREALLDKIKVVTGTTF